MIPLFHIAFSHIFLDEVDSTNAYATQLIAKSNPNEGTVITTYNQTLGKGQIGRAWFSDVNKNICTSIVLKPHFLPIKDSFYLSMIAALAVRDTIENYTQSDKVRIKWPNDIFVKNKKIAGLLIQQNLQGSKISSCICGIGLNVNQNSFPTELPNPISLIQLTGIKLDLFEVQLSLEKNIANYYILLRERSYTKIKKLYLKYLYKRGEVSEFLTDKKSKLSGEILGIDSTGKLMLNINSNVCSFSLHELRMIIN